MSWWHRIFGSSSSDRPTPRPVNPSLGSNQPEHREMPPQLEVLLPNGWSQHPAFNPDLVLLVRDKSRSPGRLEISYSVNQLLNSKMEELGLPNPESLQEQASESGKKLGCERLVRQMCGTCGFGRWGSAVFRGGTAYTGRGLERAQVAHAQHWFVMNRQGDSLSILAVVHNCFDAPDPEEIAEAEQIVLTAGIRMGAACKRASSLSSAARFRKYWRYPDGSRACKRARAIRRQGGAGDLWSIHVASRAPCRILMGARRPVPCFFSSSRAVVLQQ